MKVEESHIITYRCQKENDLITGLDELTGGDELTGLFRTAALDRLASHRTV